MESGRVNVKRSLLPLAVWMLVPLLRQAIARGGCDLEERRQPNSALAAAQLALAAVEAAVKAMRHAHLTLAGALDLQGLRRAIPGAQAAAAAFVYLYHHIARISLRQL